MEGVDCTQTISPLRVVGLRLAGKRFVCRYLAPPDAKYDWKRLKRSEVLACKATPGLELVCVFESYAGRALEGASAGAADAQTALALLRQLGIPAAPVYFAVDHDIVTTAQFAKVAAYLATAARTIAPNLAGAYAEYDVIVKFVPAVVRYGWQTAAWSRGLWSAKAAIQQYRNGATVAGVSVDLDRSTMSDFGQVKRPAPPKPKPKPPPKPQPIRDNIFRYWNAFKGKWWGFRT
jgi:sulfur carrier protein ThiS